MPERYVHQFNQEIGPERQGRKKRNAGKFIIEDDELSATLLG